MNILLAFFENLQNMTFVSSNKAKITFCNFLLEL